MRHWKQGLVLVGIGLGVIWLSGCGGKREFSGEGPGGLHVEFKNFEMRRTLMSPLFVDVIVNPSREPVEIVGRFSGSLRKRVGLRQSSWRMLPDDIAWRDGDVFFQTSGALAIGHVRVTPLAADSETPNSGGILLEMPSGEFRLSLPPGGRAQVEWLLGAGPGGRPCSVPPPVRATHPWFHNGDPTTVYTQEYVIDHGLTGERIEGEFERTYAVLSSGKDLVPSREFFRETHLERKDLGVGEIEPGWSPFEGMDGCVVDAMGI